MSSNGNAASHFVEDELYVGTPTELITEDGGRLILAPQEEIPYQFSFGIKQREEENDVLYSVVRLIDDRGVAWLGESIWTVPEIVGQMTNFNATSPPQRFGGLSQQFRSDFESACFFKGARGLLDDRFFHHLFLEGRNYPVLFKYQTPFLDLAFVEETVFARVSGLRAETNAPSSATEEIPAALFPVEIWDRLFVNYGRWDEESGSWELDAIPQRFVLKRSASGLPRQPLIHYAPDKRS